MNDNDAGQGPLERPVRPRFSSTYCSQCGGEFGPGDRGFSHCSDHRNKKMMRTMDGHDVMADALRFRWLCEHPDWHFIERLCRGFVADSEMEFLTELRRVIDARRSVELSNFEQHMLPGA